MMLGARYFMDKKNPRRTEGEKLVREAYAIDSNERYVNYYMGTILWNRDDFAHAEVYYLRELPKNPTWAELYFRLARCAIERRDLKSGQENLETHYRLNPHDSQGVNNLLMIYIETKQYDKARTFADKVLASGMDVSKEMQATIDAGVQQMKSPEK
jgi:tetratricopeptide (TPR) repeat protein